jgi:hypothetical protein
LAVGVVGALVAPVIAQMLWIICFRHLSVSSELLGLVAIGVSAFIGFACLAYGFGIYSLVLGVVYLPVMFYLLVGFSLDFVGWMYHDYL